MVIINFPVMHVFKIVFSGYSPRVKIETWTTKSFAVITRVTPVKLIAMIFQIQKFVITSSFHYFFPRFEPGI